MAAYGQARAQIDERAQILSTQDLNDLERIMEPDIQAVIYTPTTLPRWFVDLRTAVESGAFQIPRTILPNASRADIDNWLENYLPNNIVAPEVRSALKQDIVSLSDRIAGTAKISRFQLRIFTGAPTTDCGFHVDTVPPGAPTCGLLRVYNGAGTDYVHPDNVVGTSEFYQYLSRRERLERERSEARQSGDDEQYERIRAEVHRLDQERAFLKRACEVRVVPGGSIIAFKHLDVRLHWSNHAKALAWIHSSPMAGLPRLVVNVTCGSRSLPQGRAAAQPRDG